MRTVLVPQGTLGVGLAVNVGTVELHHLRVRRAQVGEMVRLTDGVGTVGTGRLVLRRGDATIEVEEVTQVPQPLRLTVALGAGERERFAWFVEKAAELGVTDILPLETERSRSVASKLRMGQLTRLRRRGREAVKQTGAAWAPEVHEPLPLAGFLEQPREGLRWLATLGGGRPPAAIAPAALTLAVGPEGGFTEAEQAALEGAGYLPLRFGEYVLRFETAALAGALYAGIARTTEDR